MNLRLLFAALLVTVSVCAIAEDVLPWTQSVIASTLEREEKNLWAEAEEFDKLLERSGKIRKDPALNNYLQHILDKLYPEFNGKVRIRVLDSSQLNAFALPNGSIYVNAGLVARFEHEAQLATVLAHHGSAAPGAMEPGRAPAFHFPSAPFLLPASTLFPPPPRFQWRGRNRKRKKEQ